MPIQRVKRGGIGVDTGGSRAGQVAAQGWSSLAQRFEQFRLREEGYADDMAHIEGQNAGMQKGMDGQSDEPDYSTIRGRAEAQGMRTGYMLAHEAESRTRLSELAAQYKNDPRGFIELAQAHAKGKLETIRDPVLRQQVQLDFQQRIEAKSLELLDQQVAFQRELGKADAMAGMRAMEGDILDNARAGRIDLVQVDQQRYLQYLEQQVVSRYLTPVDAEKARADLDDRVQSAQAVGMFHGELQQGRGWEFLQKFATAGDLGMSEEGRKRAVDEMQDMLRDWQSAEDRRERLADKAMKQRQADNESQATEQMYDGTLTAEALRDMRDRRQISPEGYNKLRKGLEVEDEPKDNPELVTGIYRDLFDGADPRSLHERMLAGASSGDIEPETYRGMVNILRSGTLRDVTRSPEWGEAKADIMRRLQTTGPMQALDQDEQRRISAATRELYDRTVAGENPLEIVDGIIERAQPADRRNLGPAIRPRFYQAGTGGQIDTAASRAQAKAAFDAGQIDLQELDKQYRDIDAWGMAELQQLQRKAAREKAAKDREERLR